MKTSDLNGHIPKRYLEAEVDPAIKMDTTKSWYLSGGIGSGKTHFCYALRRRNLLVDEGREIWIHVLNMAAFAGTLRGATIDRRTELIDLMQDRKFLILDDVGSESQTDFTNDVLFQMLNKRYEEIMWIGFTSNFRIGELPYEGRIISRIAGIVGTNKFQLTAKDRRVPEYPRSKSRNENKSQEEQQDAKK